MADTKVVKTSAERFHTNLLGLCDLVIDLIKWVPTQGVQTSLNAGLLSIAKLGVTALDPNYVITGFIQKSATYWEQVRNRDKTFLIQNAGVLFGELPPDHVKEFCRLFAMKRRMTEEDRKNIREWRQEYIGEFVAEMTKEEKRVLDPSGAIDFSTLHINPKAPTFLRLDLPALDLDDTADEVSMVPFPTLDSIWKLLKAMVRICIRCVHENRKPSLVEVEEVVNGVKTGRRTKEMRYTAEFFPKISVRTEVARWRITL